VFETIRIAFVARHDYAAYVCAPMVKIFCSLLFYLPCPALPVSKHSHELGHSHQICLFEAGPPERQIAYIF
jgi:hypothetical protein